MSDTSHTRTPDALTTAAELGLLTVTVVAVLSFARLFVDTEWRAPLIAATVIAHLTVALTRRLGRGLVTSGLVALAVMVLQITWTHYRSTATALLPTGTTRDAIDLDLTTAWELFGEVQAPTESVTGFVVLASIAVWVIAYLSDWAAFRLWSPLESMLPGFAMLIFIAFFGEERNRVLYAGLYVGAVIVFQLFHHMVRQSREVRWLAGAARMGTASLVATGTVLSAIAVLGAVAVGPALPGADEQALVDLDERDNGPSTRVVVSPIVDIRGRLIDQPDVEAFTVRSDTPTYWRLASLDSFNGQIWGADNKYSRVSGELPDDFPSNTEVSTITQDFDIVNMGAVWLPAAYEPRAVTSSSDSAISYEPVSGTLIVGTDLASSDGLQYSLVSALPQFDPAALATAPDQYPTEVLDRYLDLPGDFSPTAVRTAVSLTAGLDTNYDRALALQNYFREFTYDANVGIGHSSNRIDEFLNSGRGYCEQFAGAFAAMARSIGIPARVAVGFTWGEQDVDDPELYHVRGEHAHAWPEVYIPGSGWVAFEPTPTRGAPGAAQWTGVEAQQAGATEAEQAAPRIENVAPTPEFGSGVEDAPNPDELFGDQDSTPLTTSIPGDDTGVPGWLKNIGLGALAIVVALGAYVATVLAARRSRQSLRLRRADTARHRLDAIWHNGVEALAPLGIRRAESETIAEFTSRARRQAGRAHEPLVELGKLATVATYAASEPAPAVLATAEAHRQQIAEAVAHDVDFTTRLMHVLNPRNLFNR